MLINFDMNLLSVFVAYWSLETTLLYAFMGCIGVWAIRMTNKKGRENETKVKAMTENEQ